MNKKAFGSVLVIFIAIVAVLSFKYGVPAAVFLLDNSYTPPVSVGTDKTPLLAVYTGEVKVVDTVTNEPAPTDTATPSQIPTTTPKPSPSPKSLPAATLTPSPKASPSIVLTSSPKPTPSATPSASSNMNNLSAELTVDNVKEDNVSLEKTTVLLGGTIMDDVSGDETDYDGYSLDSDGDGSADAIEEMMDSDPQDAEDKPIDADNNGAADKWEVTYYGKSGAIKDGQSDSDGDGLSDKIEANLGSNPFNNDSDGDGIKDSDELDYGTNLLRVSNISDLLSKKPVRLKIKEGSFIQPDSSFIGMAPAGSKVKIFREDGNERIFIGETVATDNDKFIVDIDKLKDGEYKLFAQVTTDDNKISETDGVNINVQKEMDVPDLVIKTVMEKTPDNLKKDKNERIIIESDRPVFEVSLSDLMDTEMFERKDVVIVAHFESTLLTSAIVADAESATFKIQPPEGLAPGEHEVRLYVVRTEGLKTLRSGDTAISFMVVNDRSNVIYYYFGGVVTLVIGLIGIFFVFARRRVAIVSGFKFIRQ